MNSPWRIISYGRYKQLRCVGASDVVPAMLIFGRDGIDTRHGWLSFYRWMDKPNQGLESDALGSSTLFFVCIFTNIQ